MTPNYTHIQFSEGKLWALPDWPEKPMLNDKNNQWYIETGGYQHPDEWFTKRSAASIQSRVEFKDQDFVGLKAAMETKNKSLIEGEVYPCPDGWRIDVEKTCHQTGMPCGFPCNGEENCKSYAILLPVKDEVEHFVIDPSDRDWREDFSHENGNYSNKCIECGLMFNGHKRRVICKKCSTPDWLELSKRKPHP